MGYMDITVTVRAKDIGPALQCAMLIRAAVEGFDTDVNVLPFNPDDAKRGEVISVSEPRKHRATHDIPSRKQNKPTIVRPNTGLLVDFARKFCYEKNGEEFTSGDLRSLLKEQKEKGLSNWNPESSSSTMGALLDKGEIELLEKRTTSGGYSVATYKMTELGRTKYEEEHPVIPKGTNGSGNGGGHEEGRRQE